MPKQNHSGFTIRDISTSATKRKALVKKSFTHWSTKYSGTAFLGSILWATFLGLGPAVFTVGVVTFGATCISWVCNYFLSSKPDSCEKLLARGVTREDLDNFLGPSIETLGKIDNLSKRFSGEFKRKVADLRDLIQVILENCANDDPSDIKRIVNFPTHIERTANLLEKYAKLQRKASYSETIRESLLKIEKSISDLYAQYLKIFDRLQKNDVQGLKIEAETLEKILEI